MSRPLAARAATVTDPEYVPQRKLPVRTPTLPQDGIARAVYGALPNPVSQGDADRAAVLLMIAGFADSGIGNPSVREISARLPKMRDKRIVDAIDHLESEGWLEVTRGDQNRHERNQYVVVLKNSSEPKKEN